MGICYIIGAGECNNIDFVKDKDDYIICADGGLGYARKFGITPDLIVGDFDSFGSVPTDGSVIILPCEKDVTDMHYAVMNGLEKGYSNFRIYGALGGRIDHSLGNIQLLMYITDNGGNAFLVGNEFDITLLKNSKIMFNGKCGKYISVFSYTSESKGVTIKGLKYELTDAVLTNNNPLGVSNEFTDDIASVEVLDGALLITIQK